MAETHAFRRITGRRCVLVDGRSRLRRSSGGKLNLNWRCRAFAIAACPRIATRPEDFVAKLDELLGVQTFSLRYREFAAMKPFPEWRKLYADLGIQDGKDAHLQFDDAAPDAKWRVAIMTASPAR